MREEEGEYSKCFPTEKIKRLSFNKASILATIRGLRIVLLLRRLPGSLLLFSFRGEVKEEERWERAGEVEGDDVKDDDDDEVDEMEDDDIESKGRAE